MYVLIHIWILISCENGLLNDLVVGPVWAQLIDDIALLHAWTGITFKCVFFTLPQVFEFIYGVCVNLA